MRALALGTAVALAAGAASALPPFDVGAGGWRFAGVPSQPPTRFAPGSIDGAPALRIEADGSYGNWVHALPPGSTAAGLQWQWRVDRLNRASDLRSRDGDDASLKVCALFDMPLQQVPFVERQLLRLARARSGEPLPAATLCYVWAAGTPAGSALDNAWSRRVRYVVLRDEQAPLQRWLDERRDLAADFARLFGDESPTLPPLAAIAVGADADNTGGHSLGHVRALRRVTSR